LHHAVYQYIVILTIQMCCIYLYVNFVLFFLLNDKPAVCAVQAECDTYECQFDGTDCSYDTLLYQNCSAVRFDIPCYNLFNNSVCDRACNSAECLYDGWDCEQDFQPCNPNYDSYCSEHYADGFCDQGCNVVECGWDGLDCVDERQFATGRIVIVVLVSPQQFAGVRTTFLRQLGSLLRTVVDIARDSQGNEMISSWDIDDDDAASLVRRARRSVAGQIVDRFFRRKRAAVVGYVNVTLMYKFLPPAIRPTGRF